LSPPEPGFQQQQLYLHPNQALEFQHRLQVVPVVLEQPLEQLAQQVLAFLLMVQQVLVQQQK
jgi:hypothetical protein